MDEKYSFLKLIEHERLLKEPWIDFMVQECEKMGMQIDGPVGFIEEGEVLKSLERFLNVSEFFMKNTKPVDLSKINFEQFDLNSLKFKQKTLKTLDEYPDFVSRLSSQALDYIYSKIDESDVPIHQTFLFYFITQHISLTLNDMQVGDLIEKTVKSKVNLERHYGEDELIHFSLYPTNNKELLKDEHLIKIISLTDFKVINGIHSHSYNYLKDTKKNSPRWSAQVNSALGKKIISDNMAHDELTNFLTLLFQSLMGRNFGDANNKNIYADDLLCSIWEYGGQTEYVFDILDNRLKQEDIEGTLVLPNYSMIRDKYILDKTLDKKQELNNLISKI